MLNSPKDKQSKKMESKHPGNKYSSKGGLDKWQKETDTLYTLTEGETGEDK